jgi:hypothetical protein
MPSESMDELPVKAAAINLITAIPTLARKSDVNQLF